MMYTQPNLHYADSKEERL